ncbi:MAG: hypothetical protein ACJAQ6_000601 [Arenicella sp.]|jgi:hypothetical protein
MTLGFSNWLVSLVVAVALMLTHGSAVAAPDAKLQEFWLPHDEASTRQVSHQAWQDILDKYLDTEHASGVNRFDYAALKKTDRKRLGGYLDSLQAIDPSRLSRAEQFPYWVNLYNALTVQVVLQNFPVDSIRSIRFWASPFGPWDKNLLRIKNKKLSLNDIEHGILRPIWKDPRIHFAVNCASIGCPNLIGQAFSAVNSEQLMEAAASDFINHSRALEIRGDAVKLSSIFDWYGADFGANESEIMDYIGRYLDRSSKAVEGRSKFSSITKFEYHYDWVLNKP